MFSKRSGDQDNSAFPNQAFLAKDCHIQQVLFRDCTLLSFFVSCKMHAMQSPWPDLYSPRCFCLMLRTITGPVVPGVATSLRPPAAADGLKEHLTWGLC